ncbi:hypothetical protein YC2023_015827 [Brassica napus]
MQTLWPFRTQQGILPQPNMISYNYGEGSIRQFGEIFWELGDYAVAKRRKLVKQEMQTLWPFRTQQGILPQPNMISYNYGEGSRRQFGEIFWELGDYAVASVV